MTAAPAHEPLLITIHVGVAVALIAMGFVAMATVKGSPTHRRAGGIFVAAMLTLAGTGLVLVAVGPPKALMTAWAATPAFYFAMTGWLAARRPKAAPKPGQKPGAGPSEITGAAVAGFMAAYGAVLALTVKHANVQALAVGSTIAFLLAAADLAIVLRGGLTRPQRIRRHLWRMGFALVIATSAIFVAQTQRFPVLVRPYLPYVVWPPLIFTVVQIFRYRPKRRAAALQVPAAAA